MKILSPVASSSYFAKSFLKLLILLFCLCSPFDLHAENTGFFHVKKIEGRWWIVSPQNDLFISKGVCTTLFDQDYIQGGTVSPYSDNNLKKYGSPEAWRKAVAPRLLSWNFNSLGAWSDPQLSKVDVAGRRLAYAPILNIGALFVKEKGKGSAREESSWLKGIFPDVFDPEFAPFVKNIAQKNCAPLANDPYILGWFTDNEMRWGPDWRSKDELLISFLNMPKETPGRIAAISLLKEHHQTISQFNKVWKTDFKSWENLVAAPKIVSPYPRKEMYHQNQEVERQLNASDPLRASYISDCDKFLALLAERYFKITTDAIHQAAPHHMVFGCRFAYVPAQQVVESAAKYLDVISFNKYDFDPMDAVTRYSVFQKPLIIGEFGFRGEDAGLPNSKGAGPIVKDQAARANAFRSYVQKLMSSPYVVGYHWFEHADEPAQGRFDGEDSNYGIVNIHDEPYQVLVEVMREVNASAETLHKAAAPLK